MSAEVEESTTPYRQIAADLRRRIVSGELGPDAKVPSARELMETYGVATQTVQNALRMLRAEELTYSVQGRGTFVRADIDHDAISHDAEGDEPSPEYIALRNQLESLADEVRAIRQQLDELVGERASGNRTRRSAKKR